MNSSLNLAFGATSGDVITVPDCELRAVGNFKEAVRLCIKLSRVRRTQADLACLAGINVAQFSKVLNGSFHLPGDAIAKVERLCGNTAITQYLAKQHGALLKFETEVERLRRENEELRNRVAA